jgi:hypothetical protein
LDFAGGIRHGDLALDGVAEVGESAAEPLLMGVEHASEQQFAAGVDEFDIHAPSFNGEPGEIESSKFKTQSSRKVQKVMSDG